MPTANVQIAIGVQRQSALRKLQKQLERLERQARDLTVGFGITKGLRQLKRVDKELDLIRADAKNIPVSFKVDKRGLKNAQGGGGGGGDSSGGGGLAASLLTLKAFEQTAEFQKQIAESYKELTDNSEDYQKAAKGVADAQDKVAAQTLKADNIIQQMKDDGLEGLREKSKQTGRSLKQLQNDQKNAFTRAQGDLKRYEEQLEQATEAERKFREEIRKRAEEQVRANRKGSRLKRVGGSLAAGAAFSNLPGSGYAGAAGAGALIGGLPGAAIAVTAKAILDASAAMGKFAVQSTIAAAEIRRLEIALTGVVGDQTPQALAAIGRSVKDFNTPLKQATQNFTQLSAATAAAGFSVAETEEVYRGLTAANKALGGDAEKLNGILLATTQVFSKGKVTAEELRGQIGERLPGAVSLFAKATGRTTAELDKALTKGEVGLDEFLKFTKKLFEDYEEQAKKIASGPEEAGARLQVALGNLGRSMGTLLAPIGAAFQDLFTEIVNAANEFVKTLNSIFGVGAQGAYAKAKREFDVAFKKVQQLENGTAGRSDLGSGLKVANEQLERARKNLQKIQATNRKNAGFGIEVDLTKPADSSADGGGSGSTKSLKNASEYVKETERRLALLQAETPLAKELLQLEFDRKDALLDITENVLPEFQQAAADAVNTLYDAERGNAIGEALAQDLQDAIELKRAEEEALLPLKEQEALLRARLQGKEEEVALEQELERILRETPSLDREKVRSQLEVNKGLEKEVEQMLELEAIARSIADAFTGALMDGIKGLIDGTKSLNDVLSDMLSKLADVFLNIAMGQLSGGVSNLINDLIQPRAMGGPVNAGEPYLVGEQGPELMVPGQSGSVVPNDAFSAAARALSRGGGAGYAGMDATGAQAEAFAASNGALAGQVSNYSTYNNTVNQQAFNTASAARATTTEINRNTSTMNQIREYEERVMNNPSALKVDYQATVINNQTYVTEEQFQKGLTQSTNRARQATIRDLRNNPASRKMAGVNK